MTTPPSPEVATQVFRNILRQHMEILAAITGTPLELLIDSEPDLEEVWGAGD